MLKNAMMVGRPPGIGVARLNPLLWALALPDGGSGPFRRWLLHYVWTRKGENRATWLAFSPPDVGAGSGRNAGRRRHCTCRSLT